MRALLIFALCTALILPVHALQIVEFCPDTYLNGEADEYFVLSGEGGLDPVRISDGEGSVRFPPGSRISGRITIARQGDAFARVHGVSPAFEIYDSSPLVPDMIRSGDLRLANRGDGLELCIGSETVQTISWPDMVETREGQVHFLSDDTWDPRPLLLGQSRFAPATFDEVSGTAFVSPDCAAEVLQSCFEGATDSIRVNIYEFTHSGIAEMLTAASKRGVEVEVLLEGGPVGGIPEEEEAVAAILTNEGIPVWMMTGAGDIHAKYRFDHAKYIILDGDAVLLTSENFKPTGFPPSGTRGNRGWGVLVEDRDLAGYFSEVYDRDCTGDDITPLTPSSPSFTPDIPDNGPYEPEFFPLHFEGARVTPVLAPDTAHLITNLIESADSYVEIEQAYISNWSGDRANPFLDAAIGAARRGVEVRVLLDSYYYNIEGEQDNDEMVAWLNALAEKEGIPLEARCADLEGNNLVKIHNKGVIVDHEQVLVSSINWNENSACFNRETGVIIEHPAVGAYFTAVFDDDWTGAKTVEGVELRWYAAAGVGVVLFLLYVRRRWR